MRVACGRTGPDKNRLDKTHRSVVRHCRQPNPSGELVFPQPAMTRSGLQAFRGTMHGTAYWSCGVAPVPPL
jgi:hypothetical protein